MGKVKFGPGFYITILFVLVIGRYDIKNYLYLFPTPYLIGIAFLDNAFADLPAYIMKHHKIIINLVFLRYISPHIINWIIKFITGGLTQYKGRKNKINYAN
ncbi:MAG: hypothetical protein GX050_07625 [Firmicutes bacterium]|nr:hypothetical protein [Bacillota bacterium]